MEKTHVRLESEGVAVGGDLRGLCRGGSARPVTGRVTFEEKRRRGGENNAHRSKDPGSCWKDASQLSSAESLPLYRLVAEHGRQSWEERRPAKEVKRKTHAFSYQVPPTVKFFSKICRSMRSPRRCSRRIAAVMFAKPIPTVAR